MLVKKVQILTQKTLLGAHKALLAAEKAGREQEGKKLQQRIDDLLKQNVDLTSAKAPKPDELASAGGGAEEGRQRVRTIQGKIPAQGSEGVVIVGGGAARAGSGGGGGGGAGAGGGGRGGGGAEPLGAGWLAETLELPSTGRPDVVELDTAARDTQEGGVRGGGEVQVERVQGGQDARGGEEGGGGGHGVGKKMKRDIESIGVSENGKHGEEEGEDVRAADEEDGGGGGGRERGGGDCGEGGGCGIGERVAKKSRSKRDEDEEEVEEEGLKRKGAAANDILATQVSGFDVKTALQRILERLPAERTQHQEADGTPVCVYQY